jgi:tetratricopeptide (TPR) repeat protein
MSRGIFVTALLISAWLAVAPAVEGAGKWTRMRSSNFTLEGDVSPAELADVARRLEQFREVLGTLLPGARLVAPTPVTVLVFARARDFRTVAPLYLGKPIEVSGLASVTLFGTGIALCLEGGEQAYQTIYHEFAHLLLSNALPHMPLWLEEGLAEFYSTFDLSPDRTRARIGKPIPAEEFQYLREGRMLPMRELLTATRESPLYNSGVDRSRFYAYCWATVHYLVLGNPARFAELSAFIGRLSGGMAEDAALTASFAGGSATLEKEMTDYVGQPTFPVGELQLHEGVDAGRTYPSRALSAAEVEASTGHMLLKQQRFDEAESRFRSAVRLDAKVGAGHSGLGLVRTLQGKVAEALPSLKKGAELDADEAMAHHAYGFGILHCENSECGPQAELRATAIREFARAVELAPPFPGALSYLGLSEMNDALTLPAAERHGLEAVRLLPGREDYRVHLAQAYVRQHEYAKALALLRPIAASSRQGLQADARRLLAGLPDVQESEIPNEALSVPAAPPAASFAPSLSVLRREAAPATPRPLFRTIGAGEQQMEGSLDSIECGGGGVRLVLGGGIGPKRFGAAGLAAIEFISYRSDVRGNASCGSQQPMPVLLTWRNRRVGESGLPTGIDGVVVAVEYVSK